jgi:beta-galactosidase
MRHAILCLLSAAIGLACLQAGEPDPSRATFNFNPGWRLGAGDPAGAEKTDFSDTAWKQVTLPHAWNEDDAFRKDISELSTGIAWYRKTFTLPPSATGKKVFLEFEGERQAGEFFVNGQSAGRHENGVMAVGLDITNFVRPAPGANVIAVRTDNAWNYREKATNQTFQWSDKNFNANYGGIPKNVRLHVCDRLYQTLPLFSEQSEHSFL